jgi:hypothetical protein
MKKLKLDLNDLKVESFETANGSVLNKGTIHGQLRPPCSDSGGNCDGGGNGGTGGGWSTYDPTCNTPGTCVNIHSCAATCAHSCGVGTCYGASCAGGTCLSTCASTCNQNTCMVCTGLLCA